MASMKICTDDEHIEVDPNDVGQLEAAMLFKAEHIKAKADPELFAAVAEMLSCLWDSATKRVDVVRCRSASIGVMKMINCNVRMDVREKLVELIESARYWGSNTSEEIAENLIKNGVTVQEWISVEDRLPEDQEEVLVCTRLKNGIRNIDKGYMAIDRFIHRGHAEVTHWMPLPQPPKGE